MKLTGSQVRSAIALALASVVTVNEILKSAAGIPGLHIPLGVTAAVQLAALCVTAFSRSLDAANSGNGAGLVNVGTASAAPAPNNGATAPISTAQIENAQIETATGPELLTASGSAILDVIVPRLPPEMQAVAAGVLSGMLADHLKAEGEEAQTQAVEIKTQAAEKKKNLTLMGGIGEAADARAAGDEAADTTPVAPPAPNKISDTGGSAASPIGDMPPPVLRQAQAEDAPALITESSQE